MIPSFQEDTFKVTVIATGFKAAEQTSRLPLRRPLEAAGPVPTRLPMAEDVFAALEKPTANANSPFADEMLQPAYMRRKKRVV